MMNICMKKCLTAFWLASLIACSSVKPTVPATDPALAMLVVPFSIDLLTVDGAFPDPPFKRTVPYVYQVAPGSHELEFVYKRTWGAGEGSELVATDVFAVTVDVSAGQRLEVGYPDDSESKRANKQTAYKRDFALWLTDPASGRRIDAAYSRPFRGILDTAKFSFGARPQAEAPASVDTTSVGSGDVKSGDVESGGVESAGVIVPVFPSNSVAASQDSSSLEQLKSWWTRASQQERADFLIWSTSQN